MSITVNRRKLDFREGETVEGLLKRLNYNFPLIIVKVDGDLIRKSEYSSKLIYDGSSIDIIHLTSGG
jgi:thiamine biosynthesis protein ThiS